MVKVDFHSIWAKCLQFIKDNISDDEFNVWFKDLKAVALKDNTLTLKVPSQFYYEYIESHYIQILRAAIVKEIGTEAKLLYTYDISNTPTTLPSNNKDYRENPSQPLPISMDTPAIRQLPNPFVMPGLKPVKIESRLNENYSFDNFIEGHCNQLARSAGHAVAANPGKTAFNPFFIYSNVGLGKTHLAHAIGLETKKIHPEKTVLYVSADTLHRQYMAACAQKVVNDLLQFYQMVDVLIIDDIQFIKTAGMQEIFFQIFNELHSEGKQLIFTSDKAPADITGLEQRVLSRLKWGLSAELQVPDLDTRIKIIKNKLMNAGGINMPEEVIQYLAFSVNTSIRELEGALTSLMAHATVSKKDITIELARQIVDGFVKSNTREITIDYIQKVVCGYFNISLEKMLSNSRKHEIVEARHITMFLARKHTGAPLTTIGEKCGHRNHATVLHGCRAVENFLDTDQEYKNCLAEIEKKILD